MSLLQLPPELLEQILIEVVFSGAPNTVAAVSACCHLLHDLVHAIWRDLFLTVFDDPRSKDALLASGPGEPCSAQPPYNWNKFTSRIAAANYLAGGDPDCGFETLVDVVLTTPPVPRTRALDPVQPGGRRLVLPPLLRQLPTSRNTLWLEQVLANGYPPLLTRRLLASFDPEGPEASRPEFEDTARGKGFNKFTFMRGFIPIDPDQTSSTVNHQYATARAIARSRVYNTKYLMPERCWGPFQPLDPNQPHVYAWRNRLSRYTPSDSDSQDADIAIRSASSSRRYNAFHPSSIVLTPTLLDSDDDIDDPDYDPDGSEMGDDAHGDTPHLLQFLSSRGMDFTDNRTHPTYVFPAPHRVVPDYAFLAAARYIMEANMRDKFEMENHFSTTGSGSKQAATEVGLELREVVDAMQSLELVRMGGAPGFWDIWRPEKPEGDEEEVLQEELTGPTDKGKGKAIEERGDEVEGWDWAGVEGEWRRVVCWLDYRDLLMHNVDIATAGFGIDDLQETIRIFPMSLRVQRYSRPPRPPPGAADPTAAIWRLPIIHVEGESRGTDTDETSARVIEGTVRMIGDGAVRWSMTSSEAQASDPEWVTESVQVGGIGSALGIIGLWTGAEHSSTDPIGPCWAWKVT